MSAALFANLTDRDFLPGNYRKAQEARLYALANLIWEEVHKTDGPRSESQIRVWLAEMAAITYRRGKK